MACVVLKSAATCGFLMRLLNQDLAGFIVALTVMSVGTPGCGPRDAPDEAVASPSLPDAGPPAIGQGVNGRITDDSGRPIARALVVPRSLDENSPPIPEIAVFSDAAGQYAWRLSPGRYEFSVTTDGYEAATVSAMVNSSQVTTVDITLKRLP
jgi:hypothetical protein